MDYHILCTIKNPKYHSTSHSIELQQQRNKNNKQINVHNTFAPATPVFPIMLREVHLFRENKICDDQNDNLQWHYMLRIAAVM